MSWKKLSSWAAIVLLAAPGIGADSPLADAVEKMDRQRVLALLQHPSDVNAPQLDGMTPLHWAVYQDDLETATLLVSSGANPKAANRYGVTPLSLASQNGNGKMVELLLDVGADPNTALRGGETPLMTAARTGKIEAVKALLKRGADVHAQEDRGGQTALMWAAAEGYSAVVEELIQAGADFRTALNSGFTPLLFAVRQGHIGVAQILLKAGADVNASVKPQAAEERSASGHRLPLGTTPLLLAVKNAHFELAAYLLESGAHADGDTDLAGYTPLHAITVIRRPGYGENELAPEGSGRLSSSELVKELAAHGAKLNAPITRRVRLTRTGLNLVGATPFLMAARTADTELMRQLVELGADPLLPNEDNTTPLLVAAGVGASRHPDEDAGSEIEAIEAVKLALTFGNEINAVDKSGETAMHGAAYKHFPKLVRFLADNGAKIEIWNQENKYGWIPLAIALGYRFGTFKPSPETEAELRRVMIARGVTPPEAIKAQTQQVY